MDSSTNLATDRFGVYGTKTDLQIRSLISVIKHRHIFHVVENTFSSNSGTKGIMFLDFLQRLNYPVYISGNTFR